MCSLRLGSQKRVSVHCNSLQAYLSISTLQHPRQACVCSCYSFTRLGLVAHKNQYCKQFPKPSFENCNLDTPCPGRQRKNINAMF